MQTLKQLEVELSPHAKHAFETYLIAFEKGDQNMTVLELRKMIVRLYGKAVDAELENYLFDRRSIAPPIISNGADQPTNEDKAATVAEAVLYHIDTMYPDMWNEVPKSARTSLKNFTRQRVLSVLT